MFKKLRIISIALASISILSIAIAITLPIGKTSALNGSDFNPERIIDDAVFYNSNAMSSVQIQAFLNAKVPSCDTNGVQSYSYYFNTWTGEVNNSNGIADGDGWVTTSRAIYGARVADAQGEWRGSRAPYTCMKDKVFTTPSIAGDSLCNGYNGAANESAANIIYKVAVSCGINPQVLLITLQKEQSLTTETWPWGIQYDKAMGYYCPDNPPQAWAPTNCHPDYLGFSKQVYYGARVFKNYKANPNSYNYRAGRNNNIQWNPNPACGSSNVYIQNQATAALYIYTPYRPNQAALDNLYGTGDGCSSYGNRNFWRMFNDWFGPSIVQNTIGNLDSATRVPGGVLVTGWTIDPDTSNSIDVHVYGGSGVANPSLNPSVASTANVGRADINIAYPGYGALHGFSAVLPLAYGQHKVCVYGVNAPNSYGASSVLGCRDIGINNQPMGSLDTMTRVPGGVQVSGWSLDPDTANPINVHIYGGDGTPNPQANPSMALTANVGRADIGLAFPNYGVLHGYSAVLPLTQSYQKICAYGINAPGTHGSSVLLGCREFNVNSTPMGSLDSAIAVPGGVQVSGWSLDPDTANPINVHIYGGDGTPNPQANPSMALTANVGRADIGLAFPNYGVLHGYSAVLPLTPGRNKICAYGVNVINTPGSSSLIGCRDITVN